MVSWVRRVYPGAFSPEMPWREFLALYEDIPTLLRREQSLQLDVALYLAAVQAGDDAHAKATRDNIERTVTSGARWDGDAPDLLLEDSLAEKKRRYREARPTP